MSDSEESAERRLQSLQILRYAQNDKTFLLAQYAMQHVVVNQFHIGNMAE